MAGKLIQLHPSQDRIAEAALGVSLVVGVLTPTVEAGLNVTNDVAASILDELRDVRRLLVDKGDAA